MKKLLGLLVVLLVVVVLGGTAGCGGDDDDGGDASATGSATEDATATVEATDDTGDAGGDVDPEVEAYFDAVVEIADRTNTALDEVNERLSTAVFDTDAEEIEATQKAFEDIVRALESAAVDLAGLDLPEVAATEHEEFLTAVGDYYEIAGLFYEDLLRAMTIEDLDGLVAEFDPHVRTVVEDTGAKCRDLEELGRQYIDGLDLACPGDGE